MRVCIFGNKETTRTLITHLINKNITIDCLVTLNSESAKKVDISGKSSNLVTISEKFGLEVYQSNSYNLKEAFDTKFFENNKFDVGLCTGWQRLIPKVILDTFKHGVFGWHGSGFEFPNGRGRSPLNWSLRLGLPKIYHNCFKYSAGADAGDIYETDKFSINQNDYISDIQYKAVEHILNSSERLLSDIDKGSLQLLNQPNYPYFQFPSLTEGSGELFPTEINCKTALQIIKSCSRPFPGAFLLDQGKKFRIWRARIVQHPEKGLNSNKKSILINGKLYISLMDGFLCSSDFDVE